MMSIIRALIIVLALGLAPVPQAAADTDFASTMTKLVLMDAELARCWRQRALAALIAVNYLRECIAERRGAERDLKEALNKGIGVLGTDDPERDRLLSARNALREFSRFMALLDDGLKDNAPEMASYEVQALVDATCGLVTEPGSGSAPRDGAHSIPMGGAADMAPALCQPTEGERQE